MRNTNIKTEWDLTLFYKDHNDPQIEKDISTIEKMCSTFANKYSKIDFEKNHKKLLESLLDYEKIYKEIDGTKPGRYFRSIFDSGLGDTSYAQAKLAKINERVKKARNKIVFYTINIGKISKTVQGNILKNKKFSDFKYYLTNKFKKAKHRLSEKEEKVLSLVASTSYSSWTDGQQKLLGGSYIVLDGKNVPLSEVANSISKETNKENRKKLHTAYTEKLKEISPFAESEINAVFNFKKVQDELRGFKNPYESTLLENENSVSAIQNLIKTVTENFDISHEFSKLKAEVLGLQSLGYEDRGISIGEIKKSFSFEDSVKVLEDSFGEISDYCKETFKGYIHKGQIDVYPRKSKKFGAYMSGAQTSTSLVLLNHVNDFYSLQTFGHEMGHAFHTELSKSSQKPLYVGYSTSTAETASTFFEQIVFDFVLNGLATEEKKIALFDRVNRDIATIFRQIACFNFELELHQKIQEKGFVDKKEIGKIHNDHMKSYLGPLFELTENDGYMFVSWPHLRYYFYVYTYAYGLLVSKVILKRYRENPAYLEKIEQFLKAGGSDTPENIFKKISIDVTKKEFFKEGLEEIREDIKKLRKMLK